MAPALLGVQNRRTVRQPPNFGIEEEYLLLDSRTGVPTNHAGDLLQVARAAGFAAEREYLACQLETSTPICTTADQAAAALQKFRTSISDAALEHSITLAGIGLPPFGGDRQGTVTPYERYLQISPMLQKTGWTHYSTGMHVHVEIPSQDAGVEVIARVAQWMPVLVALSGNSPIWLGKPTGFASWRYIRGLNWPVSGFPPLFDNSAQYQRSVKQMIASQIILDEGVVSWVIRLSKRFPTLEFRFADSQLRAEDSVALALIVRALVVRCLTDLQEAVPKPHLDWTLVSGAVWCAACDALSGTLVDPTNGDRIQAHKLVGLMLEWIGDELEGWGDTDRVESFIARRLQDKGPANLQLERLETHGVPGLIELYRSEMVA